MLLILLKTLQKTKLEHEKGRLALNNLKQGELVTYTIQCLKEYSFFLQAIHYGKINDEDVDKTTAHIATLVAEDPTISEIYSLLNYFAI